MLALPHEPRRSARPSPAAPHRPVLRDGPRGDAPIGHGEQGTRGEWARGSHGRAGSQARGAALGVPSGRCSPPASFLLPGAAAGRICRR